MAVGNIYCSDMFDNWQLEFIYGKVGKVGKAIKLNGSIFRLSVKMDIECNIQNNLGKNKKTRKHLISKKNSL